MLTYSRKLFLLLLLVSISFTAFSQEATPEKAEKEVKTADKKEVLDNQEKLIEGIENKYWVKKYLYTDEIRKQNRLIKKIYDKTDEEIIKLTQYILVDFVYGKYRDYANGQPSERAYWYENVRLLIEMLGKNKVKEAAPVIYQVFSDFIPKNDPEGMILRSAAILALGQMEAKDYSIVLARRLYVMNDANTKVESIGQKKKELMEREALFLIKSLFMLNDPDTYEVLFRSYVGWYRNDIRSRVGEFFKKIDPTEAFIKILDNINIKHKLALLELQNQSKASKENKILMARSSLSEGHSQSAQDETEKAQLWNLREKAMQILKEEKSQAVEDVPLLDLSYQQNRYNEKLLAVQTLGVNATDEAVKTLGSYLENFNDLRARDWVPKTMDEKMIKQVIYALGATGKEKAADYLDQVEYVDYSQGIIDAAKEELKKIEK